MSWEYVKLNELGSTYTGLSNKKADDFGSGKPYITYLNIFNNSKIDPSLFEKVEVGFGENQNKAKYGDIFFTTSSETPDEVGMCSVLLDNVDELYLNSFCFGFRLFTLDTIIPEYARYCFRSEEFRKQIGNLAQGSTRYNLSKSYFLESSVLITTDPKEQKKIADILESVDNSIESTKKAIEKYKLVKQGMMQDLLTRGLDENGKLRPTYEESPEIYKLSKLGYIPKEWDVKSILDVATISSGGTPNRSNALYWDGDIPWVTTGEVNFNTIIDTKEKITEDGMNYSAAKLFDKGTILMAMYGQGVTRAKCAILGIKATTNQACAAIRTFDINNMFLYHYLRFSYNALRNLSNDGSQQNLNSVLIGTFTIIKPTKESEQQQIADRLTSIDNKIEAEQTYLKKLQKIKQGLMQDLLTGKVRCKF